MNYFNAGWYVIYTRPQQERKVVNHLARKNIEHYFPTVKRLSYWHDRKKLLDMPLFPSYVFVLLNEQKDYYDVVNNNPGFLYFVKAGDVNARLEERVIEGIKLILDNGKDIECTTEYIKPGEEMEIREGPFAGLCCEIVEHDNKQKVLVKLNLLNRNILASLPVEYLHRSEY